MSSAKLWKRARAIHMLKHCLETGMEGYFDYIHKAETEHQEMLVDEALNLLNEMLTEVREDATLALEIVGGGPSGDAESRLGNSGREEEEAYHTAS